MGHVDPVRVGEQRWDAACLQARPQLADRVVGFAVEQEAHGERHATMLARSRLA
jgi:hypothetical protein